LGDLGEVAPKYYHIRTKEVDEIGRPEPKHAAEGSQRVQNHRIPETCSRHNRAQARLRSSVVD
jgi:hypothetical protein